MVLELELEELKGKVDQLMDLIDLIEEDLYYSNLLKGEDLKEYLSENKYLSEIK